MKKYIYIYLLFCVIKLNAQQLPQYSNYMLNGYVMNPAVGGSNPYFEAKSDNRYQWVGITDAPRTYILSVNGPTKSLKMGLGGILFNDLVGPTRRTGAYLSYAYHMTVTDKIKGSLGISAGVLQFAIDASKISLHDPNDNTLGNNNQSIILPDFGAGAYLYSTDKKWYIGVSMPQILQNQIKYFNYTTATSSRLASHAYLIGAYLLSVGNGIQIEPSACLKYVKPAPMQFDLGLRAIYKEKFWIGGAFRYLDALSAMVGYTVKENLTFAYTYDFTTTNIKKYSTGTHELMIGIRFHKRENQENRVK